MINITAGANSATTQAANTRQERTPKLEKAPNTNEEKTSASNKKYHNLNKKSRNRLIYQQRQRLNKNNHKRQPNPQRQKTKVTTPPSTNTPQPMQSTKSDTPQSPTIKQAQTDMTPKYEDLRAYYTKPSFEFEKQFGFLLKPWTTVRFMNVIPNRFIYKIALVGKMRKNIKMDLTIISMYLSF